MENGASFIYREVEFALHRRPVQRGRPRPGRRRGRSAPEGRTTAVKLPIGYKYDWGGEYKEYLASREQMKVILPLTVLLILMILFALYGNLKFPLIIFFSVLVTEPVGGLLALWATRDQFQRLFDVGFRGVDGRRRADQRHSVFVHQQAAAGREGPSRPH